MTEMEMLAKAVQDEILDAIFEQFELTAEEFSPVLKAIAMKKIPHLRIYGGMEPGCTHPIIPLERPS